MPEPVVSSHPSPTSASLTSSAPPPKLTEANSGRDYTIYSRAMDAAEDAKALDIFPYMKVPEGGTILDLGAGTAGLSERAARYFSRAHVVAQDVSHELLEIADHRRALIHILFGNALDQVLPENSLDAAMCSSCGHEIESFCGTGSMQKVLEVMLRELKPGAAFVHRDFIKPDAQEVMLEILDSNVREAEHSAAISGSVSDYSKLTTAQLFFRFHKEFAGGNAFSYAIEEIRGRTFIRLPAEWAYEFYMRKDYVANWHNEIREKYSYWSESQARQAFEEAGFVDVRVIPHRNQWLVDNRLDGRIALFSVQSSGELEAIPFFDTHMTVLGVKPGARREGVPFGDLPLVNYDRALSEIRIDRAAGTVDIGTKHFELSSAKSMLGTKREVFFLSGEPRCVLKIPRVDGLNVHNCFKAMQQTIVHDDILDLHRVPHPKVLEFDTAGPPFRFLVQEALPEGAECAADLIEQGRLTEADIEALATIVNSFEREKRWQLDTNPFNWYRVIRPDGKPELMYADGKVYRYDEKWSFARVGLLQWIDPRYVREADGRGARIPEAREVDNPSAWWSADDELCHAWERHLDASLLPVASAGGQPI
ncbi:MAG: methyltransferase domain-containing protein [Deltaproteobacteria bacterium]|nr:methyltransferase domain-containing protein [Deltaproteobacteria bacterium]